MQGSFEKDVHRKLDDLRLTPSAPVWEKIELEIKPEKRKRRLLFWLLPLGLLLAGGGWWLLHSPADKPLPSAEAAATPVIGNKPINTVKVTPKQQSKTQQSTAKETATEQSSHLPEATIADGHTPEKKALKQSRSTDVKVARQKANPSERKPVATTGQPAKTQPEETTNAVVENKSTPLAQPLEKNKAATAETATTVENEKPLRSLKTDSVSKAEAPVAATDTTLKKKAAKAGKWRKQFSLGTGLANVTKGTQSGLVYAANFNSAPIGSVAPNPPGAASPVRAGLALAVGFSLAKNLGKRWEVSVGLHYTQATTRQRVGDRRSTDTTLSFAQDRISANGFYTNNGQTDYTNRYHLLEVPVAIAYKTGGRLPVCFSAGAAYGRLLATNVLTYNSGANLYYRNGANDRRNLLPVFSSVQAELFSRRKVSLRTGPFVQYHLQPLQKESGSAAPHLFLAGLKTAVNF